MAASKLQYGRVPKTGNTTARLLRNRDMKGLGLGRGMRPERWRLGGEVRIRCQKWKQHSPVEYG